jgi:hypothetical protein
MKMTEYQERIAEIDPEINIAMLGGKGGGKTVAAVFTALRREREWGSSAKMMAFRRSYPSLREFESTTREVFDFAFDGAARYASSTHLWKFPSGGFLELSQLDSFADLRKVHGRSVTWMFLDEIGQYASSELPDRLRANMRAPKGIKPQILMAGNPGDVGQAWLYKKFIAGKKPWKAYKDERGTWWLWAPSTLDDNPMLDRDVAEREIRSSTTDPEMVKALLLGDFVSKTGAYFGMCLDESRNAVGPFRVGSFPTSHGQRWRSWISVDHGGDAPTVAYLFAESPGATWQEVFYPRGSIIAVDEYANYRPDNLNKSHGENARQNAERIARMCEAWGVPASGYADDAMFAATTGHTTSISNEYAIGGVRLRPAKKGRREAGWEVMRRLLTDAGSVDRPGLYLSRACAYAWLTLPFLARSTGNSEDVDSNGPDHGADALRYGVLRGEPPVTKIHMPFAN